MLEITVSHWPFPDQFQHLANQNWLNFTYIFNGIAVYSICKKSSRPIVSLHIWNCCKYINKGVNQIFHIYDFFQLNRSSVLQQVLPNPVFKLFTKIFTYIVHACILTDILLGRLNIIIIAKKVNNFCI